MFEPDICVRWALKWRRPVSAPLATEMLLAPRQCLHTANKSTHSATARLSYSDILSNSSGKLAKTMATRLASSDVSSLNCCASASLSRE